MLRLSCYFIGHWEHILTVKKSRQCRWFGFWNLSILYDYNLPIPAVVVYGCAWLFRLLVWAGCWLLINLNWPVI